MVIVKPFKALRPTPAYAAQVAALPYDVMSSAEAKEMAAGNPYSFLHVDKAEIDLPPETDIYAPEVYAKAAANLQKLAADGILQADPTACLYIYRQEMDGRRQSGLVACTAVDDYLEDRIKKHEFTRADKEADRIRHVDTCDANTGPIFLTYPGEAGIAAQISGWQQAHAPVYDFTAEDGVGHTVWVIDDPATIAAITAAFAAVPALYIADGHHRAASAVRVGQRRRAQHPGYTGEEEFNFFLSVIFPADELAIMDYNRVIQDLGGLTEADFLARLAEVFEITPAAPLTRPAAVHTMSLCLPSGWYTLKVRPGRLIPADPQQRLDVAILQTQVLEPILGIADPRTDKRIDFVGGIRGLAELEARVQAGAAAAFAMYPTQLADLMAIADMGEVMPPKSTWFEPKLRSGLFIHKLS